MPLLGQPRARTQTTRLERFRIAMPPSDQTSDQPRNNSPRRAALLTVIVLGLGVVALNWPYRYTVAMSQGLGGMTTPVDFSPLADDPPRLGGWPFRFVVSYDATETQAAYRVIALCPAVQRWLGDHSDRAGGDLHLSPLAADRGRQIVGQTDHDRRPVGYHRCYWPSPWDFGSD